MLTNGRIFVPSSIATPEHMLKKIYKLLEDKERAWRNSFGDDISTPAKRAEAQRHFDWVDHGILRIWWTNFFAVAEGVYRSNHPSQKRLASYKNKGIKSILNLRGISNYSFYLFEKEACDALGLNLTSIHMSATRLPTVERILELESHFKTLQKPFVLHCKSGADRAGFVSALYLLLIENQPIEVARTQLGLKFAHVKSSQKGVLDFCLDSYRARLQNGDITFRDWITTEYDPATLQAEFASKRSFAGYPKFPD